MAPGEAQEPTCARAWAVGCAVFATVFGIYAWTCGPSLGFLDSPELIAAALSLGVAHSPGHPLPTLLGHAAALIPLGDAPFRVNLASAVAGAGAAALLFVAARRAGRARLVDDARGWAVDGFAAAIALVYALAWAAWSQSVRTEVYALQALLTAAILVALERYHAARVAGAPATRYLHLAALCGGLALANHHVMALFVLVPAAAWVLVALRPALAIAATTALAGVSGLAALLYLPVRAATYPAIDWGAPRTLGRLIWTVSGAAFAKNLGGDHASPLAVDAAQIAVALITAATPLLAVLATFGVALELGRRDRRGVTLFLLGTIALSLAGRAVLGFDPETPDHHAYLLPALLAIALLAIHGGAALAARRGGRGLLAGLAVVTLAAAGWQLVRVGPRASETEAYAADDVARFQLAGLPPRALALTSYFQSHFRLWAIEAIEDPRPDVAFLDRGFLTYPGSADDAAHRAPELAAVIAAPLRIGAPTPRRALAALHRPIAFELDPTLDDDLLAELDPRGGFAVLGAAPIDGGAPDDRALRAALDARLAEASGDDRDGADAALLWHDFNRLRWACATHHRDLAQAALASAWTRSPDDDTLRAMAEQCGLVPP